MASNPRPWPTRARQQRDEAADVAADGRQTAAQARTLLDDARQYIRTNPMLCGEMLLDLSCELATVVSTFADIERLMAQAQALDENEPRHSSAPAADAAAAVQLYLAGRLGDGDLLAILHTMRQDLARKGGA